jgi:hypothetical protein
MRRRMLAGGLLGDSAEYVVEVRRAGWGPGGGKGQAAGRQGGRPPSAEARLASQRSSTSSSGSLLARAYGGTRHCRPQVKGPGCVIGEIALDDGAAVATHSVSARARGAVTLVKLTEENLLQALLQARTWEGRGQQQAEGAGGQWHRAGDGGAAAAGTAAHVVARARACAWRSPPAPWGGIAFASNAFRNCNATGLATAPNRVQEISGSQSGRFRVRASLDGSTTSGLSPRRSQQPHVAMFPGTRFAH